MIVNIKALINDASGYEKIRELRWPNGVCCPQCGSAMPSSETGMISKKNARAMHAKRAVADSPIAVPAASTPKIRPRYSGMN
ncbi:transposase [Candidatus Methylospira mobilis]|uniref:transposase n=1 Tax=Candidatus Methylospira mobilis TaxID=1808979 RepID=UPI00387E8FE5